MKYAVISDIHANLEALRLVLKSVAQEGVECIVCLGDVVGYGPRPCETLDLIRRNCALVIAGNHDDAVSGRIAADNFIELAGEAVARHRRELSSEQISWLKSLPHLARFDGACAAHGDFTSPTEFNYISDATEALANFRCTQEPLLFVGHTHTPGIFVIGKHGVVHRLPPQDFQLEEGKRYIVNPGSVGYPREEDGACHSSYVLYDSTAQTIRFRLLPFSVASVMQRGQQGPSPRKRKPLFVAALAALALFLSIAVLFPRSQAPAREQATVSAPEVDASDAPFDVLTNRLITVGSGHPFVRANLKMKSGDGESVQLRIIFRDASRQPIGDWIESVKTSSAKKIRVPQGALTAEFSVRQAKTDKARRIITSFNPVSAER